MSKRTIKFTLFSFLMVFMAANLSAQTVEELKAMQAEKAAQAAALSAEAADLQKKIDQFPGWKFGGAGIIGLDLNGNNDWFQLDNPNSSANGYGLSFGAFANQDQDKYFWRNLLNLNIKKVTSRLDPDSDAVEAVTDNLDISSLFGYKLTPKIALSAEAKYITSLLNFNDPGKLVASAGVTWLPISGLVVILHPLGYEKNWPGELVSSPGCKIGATYSKALTPNIAWTSNLSAFIPYSGGEATYEGGGASMMVDYENTDLVNWTWINGLSATVWKGIGVGFNLGLRQDQQLADKYQFGKDATVFLNDNPMQMYYTLGLSYAL